MKRLASLILIAILANVSWCPRAAGQPSFRRQRFVRGTVVGAVRQGDGLALREIELSRARATLYDNQNKPIASNETDLSGRFSLKTQEQGLFTLCVEAQGFVRRCYNSEFTLSEQPVLLGTIRLVPRREKNTIPIYGEVSLRDAKRVRIFDPHHGLNVYAHIMMATGQGRPRRVADVNNFGEYIIPDAPTGSDLTISAEVQKERQELGIRKLQGVPVNVAQRYDFILSNSSPRLRAIAIRKNGKLLKTVSPGDTVEIHAAVDDPESDKLEYRWLLPGGKVTGPQPDPFLEWTAPSRPGRYALGLRVTDNRGGTVRGSKLVTVTGGPVAFDGEVVDVAGKPVAGAQVEVNGRITNTNTRGRFRFQVPAADRYVLNIRQSRLAPGLGVGYGSLSRIYTDAISGGRWTLRPAKVFTVNVSQPIKLGQNRTVRDCVGSATSRINWELYAQPGLFDWQDGRGNSQPLKVVGRQKGDSFRNVQRILSRIHPSLPRAMAARAKLKADVETVRVPCSPGISVEIPPNSLIDTATGQPPGGPVQISLSTVDLNAAGQMPGDFSALDPNGRVVGMESFGAGSVEIRSGGRSYNLKPGAKAKVTIPVDGTQLAGNAGLPNRIPFLYYDEEKGVWTQEGEAQLAGSGPSAAYVKEITHFSPMNADILKFDQSCVAVELDPAAGFTLPLDVEVSMPPAQFNPNVIQNRILTVESTSEVIYNLPEGTDIVLVPFVPGTLPDGSTGDVPAGVFVVNTGGRMLSAENPPDPNADGTYYAEDASGQPTGPCASRVTLTNLAVPPLDPGFGFLQGLYFQSTNITEYSGTGIDTAIELGAQRYYNRADPRGLRGSLNLFRSKNKFGQPLGANEREEDAQYANSGDLGFGRDMYCRRNVGSDGQFDIACYVTNYGQPPADLPDQTDADNIQNVTPDATVAMEYSRVENPPCDPSDPPCVEFPDNERAVKFYVYNTNAPDSPPLIKADLDNFGERPVPQLCMVCHGGQVTSIAADPGNSTGPKAGAFASRADIMSMDSQFLPFDLHLFTFPTNNSKANQQGAFKTLNEDIVRPVADAIGLLGDAIKEVIDEWYAGGAANQDETAVIVNWDGGNPSSDTHRLYRDVFSRACRTCHMSQPFGGPAYTNSADFDTDIASVQNRVCAQRVMPHAKRTNDVFWTSLDPNMPAFLQQYGQTLANWVPAPNFQCGLAYQGGGNIPSVFDSEVYPILVGSCSGGGCHSNVGNSNFSVGNGADTAYNQLLNAATINGPANSNYIVDGDPGASYLVTRISGGPSQMPLGGTPLDQTDQDGNAVSDLDEILNWINLGAPQ